VVFLKTGAILYLTGNSSLGGDIEARKIAEELGINADRVEVVSGSVGYEDVVDAWWMLLTRGMKRVICFMVSTMDGQHFKLVSQPLRLCG